MGYIFTIFSVFAGNLIAAVSMHTVFSLAGIFFLGLPTVVKISVYALAISQRAGISPEISFLIAMIVALFVSFLFALLFSRVSPDSFVVLGLASLVATEALIMSWDDVTNGVLGIAGVQRPDWMAQLSELVVIVLIIAFVILVVEFFALKTPAGRIMRAYREDSISLQSMGVATKKFAQTIIIISGVLLSITGVFYLWRVQFLDPQTFGIPILIEIFTLGVLALSPKVRMVALAALFVTFVPEMLRFIDFPSWILGYARTLFYAVLLLILIRKLSNNYVVAKRTI